MRAATALLALLFAAPADASTTLCWRATGLMWDPIQGRAVPTSEEELARLGRAFALWEKASAGALSFRREPPDAEFRDGTAGIPRDGCVHAVLHGERNFHGELAHGGYDGTIPGGYERGYFFVSRKPDAARFETLVHEIGHALGLPHSAVPESVMFSGPRRPGSALVSEQDALDLRARWSGEAYALSGTIVTGRRHPYAAVFAVSEDGGRSYSARSDHMGRFRVAVGGGRAPTGSSRVRSRSRGTSMTTRSAACESPGSSPMGSATRTARGPWSCPCRGISGRSRSSVCARSTSSRPPRRGRRRPAPPTMSRTPPLSSLRRVRGRRP